MRQDEGGKSKDCDHSTLVKSNNFRATSPTKTGTGMLAQIVDGDVVADLYTCKGVRYDA